MPQSQPDKLAYLDAAVAAQPLAQAASELTRDLVLLARKRGATWVNVGAAFGISRQAACERFDGRARLTPQRQEALLTDGL